MTITPEFERLHTGEHNSRILRVDISDIEEQVRVRIAFITPRGKIFITEDLVFSENVCEYRIPFSLLDSKGLLLAQLSAYGSDESVMKSPILEIPVYASVDDTDCPAVSDDELKSLALLFDMLGSKQDKLIFDNYPDEKSSNPVTSSGVARAIKDVSELIITDSEVISPVVRINYIVGGHEVIITDKEGEKSFIVSDGLKGDKGDKGDTGEKGDKGDKGENGANGYTPVKGIDYFDGAKGDPGIKGDKGDNGKDGMTPVRGVDYWTDADKSEIRSYVDEAILGGEW